MENEPDKRDERNEEKPVDLRPYLCIPYWTEPLEPGGDPDTGVERPLPENVVYWNCQAIRASAYQPGEQLDVQVEVGNSGAGGGTALATVRVYWVDATAGFPSKMAMLGVASVAVDPRGGRALTRTISNTIPATASNHICLLCVVTHSLDRADKVPEPVGDRHWAQLNLNAVGAAPGEPATLPFDAANPFPDSEESFRLQVRPLELDLLHTLARQLGGSPAEVGVRVKLVDADGSVISEEDRPAADFRLGPSEQRRFGLEAEPLAELEGDQLVAVEAELFANNAERVVGSVGLVLRSPDAPPLPGPDLS